MPSLRTIRWWWDIERTHLGLQQPGLRESGNHRRYPIPQAASSIARGELTGLAAEHANDVF
jgi:hypothetical protein